MKNQYNRARRHTNNRSTRSYQPQQIFRYTNLDSTGPLGKLRGTPLQLAEKYQSAAKDASMQGDEILMQTFLQFADHYFRLQNIALENEQALKAKVPVEEVPPETVSPAVESQPTISAAPVETIDAAVLPPKAPVVE